MTGNETTSTVATQTFEGLTQPSWIGVSGEYLTIPINCSCGDPLVSTQYGLFLTYVVASGTGGNLTGLASQYNISADLLKQFNPHVQWDNSQAQQIAFIPVPGNIVPLESGIFLRCQDSGMSVEGLLCLHFVVKSVVKLVTKNNTFLLICTIASWQSL